MLLMLLLSGCGDCAAECPGHHAAQPAADACRHRFVHHLDPDCACCLLAPQCRVCACMQTQHKVQLDERDRWACEMDCLQGLLHSGSGAVARAMPGSDRVASMSHHRPTCLPSRPLSCSNPSIVVSPYAAPAPQAMHGGGYPPQQPPPVRVAWAAAFVGSSERIAESFGCLLLRAPSSPPHPRSTAPTPRRRRTRAWRTVPRPRRSAPLLCPGVVPRPCSGCICPSCTRTDLRLPCPQPCVCSMAAPPRATPRLPRRTPRPRAGSSPPGIEQPSSGG